METLKETFNDVADVFYAARTYFLLTFVACFIIQFHTTGYFVTFLAAIPMYLMATLIGVLNMTTKYQDDIIDRKNKVILGFYNAVEKDTELLQVVKKLADAGETEKASSILGKMIGQNADVINTIKRLKNELD